MKKKLKKAAAAIAAAVMMICAGVCASANEAVPADKADTQKVSLCGSNIKLEEISIDNIFEKMTQTKTYRVKVDLKRPIEGAKVYFAIYEPNEDGDRGSMIALKTEELNVFGTYVEMPALTDIPEYVYVDVFVLTEDLQPLTNSNGGSVYFAEQMEI